MTIPISHHDDAGTGGQDSYQLHPFLFPWGEGRAKVVFIVSEIPAEFWVTSSFGAQRAGQWRFVDALGRIVHYFKL